MEILNKLHSLSEALSYLLIWFNCVQCLCVLTKKHIQNNYVEAEHIIYVLIGNKTTDKVMGHAIKSNNDIIIYKAFN